MSFITSIVEAIMDFKLGIIQGVLAFFIDVIAQVFDGQYFKPGTEILEGLLGVAYNKISLTVKVIALSIALISFILNVIKKSLSGIYDTQSSTVEDILRFIVTIILVIGSTDLINEFFAMINKMWEKTFNSWNGGNSYVMNWQNLKPGENNPVSFWVDKSIGHDTGVWNKAIISVITPWLPIALMTILDAFVLFAFIKLLISSVTRLATLDCIILLSPLSCGFMTSRKGALVLSQTAKVILVNSAAVAISKAWVFSLGPMLERATELLEILFVLCWLKIGTEIERLMKEMGLSSAAMLGDVGRDMMGSIRDATLIGRGMSGAGRSVGGVLATAGAVAGNSGMMNVGAAIAGGVPGMFGLTAGATPGYASTIDDMMQRTGGKIKNTADVQELGKQAAQAGDAKRLTQLANGIGGEKGKNFMQQAINSAYGEQIAGACGIDPAKAGLDNLRMTTNGDVVGTMADPTGEGNIAFKLDHNAMSQNGFHNAPNQTSDGGYVHLQDSLIEGEKGMPIGNVGDDGYNPVLASAGIDLDKLGADGKENFIDDMNSGKAFISKTADGGFDISTNNGVPLMYQSKSGAQTYAGQKQLTPEDFGREGALNTRLGNVTDIERKAGTTGSYSVTYTRDGRKFQSDLHNAYYEPAKGKAVYGDYNTGHFWWGKEKEIANN